LDTSHKDKSSLKSFVCRSIAATTKHKREIGNSGNVPLANGTMQPTSTTWTTVSGMDVQIHGFDQFSLGIKNMNSKAVNLEFDLGWKRSEEFHRVVGVLSLGVLSLHNGCC
jgi:hypothetical protein